jgi:hypothetical protein
METQQSSFGAELLGAPAEGALSALASAGDRAALLVDAWVKQGNAAAVAVAAESAQGAARKAARRGLNVLKARGVAVPNAAHVAKVAAQPAETTEEAYLLPPDGSGALLLVIASRTAATARYTAAFVFLHDGFGILRVDNGYFSASQLKESMGRAARGGQKPVPVPVEWARYRIAEARKRLGERREPEPLGTTTAAPLLGPVPAEAPAHPYEDEGLVLSDEDAKELAKDSARLHQLPEFRDWFPPRQAVEEMLLEVGRQFTPGSQPDQEAVQKHLDEQILAATDRYFSPQVRERLATLMKDSVLSVLARSGEQAALELVAAMRAVEQAGLITDPPREVPFLRGFFEKAVAWMLAQNQGNLRIPIPNQAAQDGDKALADYPGEAEGGAAPTAEGGPTP